MHNASQKKSQKKEKEKEKFTHRRNGKNKSKRLSPCLVSHSRRRRIVVCLSTFCAECKISCMCLVRDNCILQSHAHAHTRSVCEPRQSDSAAKLSKLFAYAELGVNVASKYLTKNYSCFSLSLLLSFSFFFPHLYSHKIHTHWHCR